MAFAIQTQVFVTAGALARPLLLWHLLSLDAPTVATLWTWAIARSGGLRLGPAWLYAVFVAVWILYAADRLLDSSPSRAELTAELEDRHHFHARHRRRFRVALAAAGVALVLLLPAVSAAAMRLYLALAAVLCAWLLLIHLPPAVLSRPARPLPKELAVGVFFAAATALPAMAERPALRLQLLPVAVLFAALCSLNCVFIHAWEHPSRASQAAAHPGLRFALRHVRPCAVGLGVLAVIAACVRGPWSPLATAVAISAALLLLLDLSPPTDGTLLRAAADLALLTPLLLLIPWHALVNTF